VYSLSPPWALLRILEVERVAAFQKPTQKPTQPPKNRHGKTAISYDRRRQGKPQTDCGPMDRNCKKRQAATGKNSASIFCKDEVGGSNPPSSSRKHLKSEDFRCFLLQKMSFWNAKKIATHTVTHTPKRPERFEAHWIGSFLPTQCAFSF